MNESYLRHHQELLQEDLSRSNNDENQNSPHRPARFMMRNEGDNLTPTQTRSPLQALQESPEGYLYQIINY
jgi:hypothetical protein